MKYWTMRENKKLENKIKICYNKYIKNKQINQFKGVYQYDEKIK